MTTALSSLTSRWSSATETVPSSPPQGSAQSRPPARKHGDHDQSSTPTAYSIASIRGRRFRCRVESLFQIAKLFLEGRSARSLGTSGGLHGCFGAGHFVGIVRTPACTFSTAPLAQFKSARRWKNRPIPEGIKRYQLSTDISDTTRSPPALYVGSSGPRSSRRLHIGRPTRGTRVFRGFHRPPTRTAEKWRRPMRTSNPSKAASIRTTLDSANFTTRRRIFKAAVSTIRRQSPASRYARCRLCKGRIDALRASTAEDAAAPPVPAD